MEKRRLDEIKMKNQAVYIASYVWGNDPESNSIDDEVPGRDKPLDGDLLRRLF